MWEELLISQYCCVYILPAVFTFSLLNYIVFNLSDEDDKVHCVGLFEAGLPLQMKTARISQNLSFISAVRALHGL